MLEKDWGDFSMERFLLRMLLWFVFALSLLATLGGGKSGLAVNVAAPICFVIALVGLLVTVKIPKGDSN